MKRFTALFVVVLLAVSATLIGCEKKGPLEQMGSDADKALKNVGKAVDDAVDN